MFLSNQPDLSVQVDSFQLESAQLELTQTKFALSFRNPTVGQLGCGGLVHTEDLIWCAWLAGGCVRYYIASVAAILAGGGAGSGLRTVTARHANDQLFRLSQHSAPAEQLRSTRWLLFMSDQRYFYCFHLITSLWDKITATNWSSAPQAGITLSGTGTASPLQSHLPHRFFVPNQGF